MDFSRPGHHLGVTREENLVAVTGELGLALVKGGVLPIRKAWVRYHRFPDWQ